MDENDCKFHTEGLLRQSLLKDSLLRNFRFNCLESLLHRHRNRAVKKATVLIMHPDLSLFYNLNRG